MRISIKKGLDLSLGGAPIAFGSRREMSSNLIGLDLRTFSPLALKLLVSEGSFVSQGEPVVSYKLFPSVKIVTPFSGKVEKIIRGEKRALEEIVISLTNSAPLQAPNQRISLDSLSQQELLETFYDKGLFSFLRQRPFDIPAIPGVKPRDIFINLSDNRPFTPSLKRQLDVFPTKAEAFKAFSLGVEALRKCFGLKPKIVQRERFSLPISELQSIAQLIEIEGPYPSGSPSVHIHKVAPIKHEKDFVFTLDFFETLSIGNFFLNGALLNKRVISLAGSGLRDKSRSYLKAPLGCNINELIKPEDFLESSTSIISGDPLTGRLITDPNNAFLGRRDLVVTVLPKPKERESFSFLRLGRNKFTLTRTYLYKFFKQARPFLDTNLHGEPRPFIETDLYDSVMPMRIPVVPLMKALITNNFEQAISLGFLEVSPEDFSLPTLIDPSKTEMFQIVKDKAKEYVKTSGLIQEFATEISY